MTVASETTLAGKLIRLRPRTFNDIPLFVRWYNDPDVRHWLHMSEAPEQTYEAERIRFETSSRDPARMNWIIETPDGLPVGNIGLIAIDPVHGRAELGISIGEREYWDRGIGTEAIRLMVGFAFEKLELRRIELITDYDNERGIRCYEKCGFQTEGTLRAHRLRYGQPIDMLQMAVLSEDWQMAP
jgi:RimJ/RimL family protein N-acetyltransferase